MQRKLADGREFRDMPLLAEREDAAHVVEGYAATFGEYYVLWEERDFRLMERIDPHAFDECDMSDVLMMYDHMGAVFARTRNGTLEVTTDEVGLRVRANLGGTERGRQMYEEIKGGYIDRMSFSFRAAEDVRTYATDHDTGVETCYRTITKIAKLYDVAPVSQPANDMTSISARSCADGVIKQLAAERRQRRADKIRKIKLMIEMRY